MWNTEIYEAAASAVTLDEGVGTPAPQEDPRRLRNTLGNFATGVTVLTYASGGRYHGVTVNSFTSVSLDPPLVLVSLMRTSRALTYLLERPFTINVLGADQLTTALQFAGKPDAGAPIEWIVDDGVPRINGSLAYFQCTPWAGYDGGDHVLVIGRVRAYGQQDDTRPLLFYRGTWGALAPEGE
ncbi:flavin reductase family protein [Gordonia sp. zg691]|uniref:Flavin reductase family protein n=2 Tax=Gordonia jinghuaiqii TaxID=2758710 RepID=A0A7D7QSU9_9ACTN|nr:flavin reductase family protein [Gordonia jinghuaiqii]MBD0862305.1 flavin reductase family protein [Gordonia jinghuaiqii]MCR5978471.1 flavin reductase [Gordonia jinghuaiqii]QMT03766.1 flavin reductase family protein [Gordonia jinghuaiqii]